jgi:uncharacterized Fe-S cluster-containing radical SAM superfamily enzyme
MTKTKMKFQDYPIHKLSQEAFEKKCNTWSEHYNWILSLKIWSNSDIAWFEDQRKFNKIYDV